MSLYPYYQHLNYLVKAQSAHGLHSPFVYQLYTRAITDATIYPEYQAVENLRNELLTNHSYFDFTDFGAKGSEKGIVKKQQVSATAGRVLKSEKYAQLLYRLARFLKPRTMLELGTSFGISTSYQALGAKPEQFNTLEGCPATAAIAEINLKKNQIANTKIVIGNFENTLHEVLINLATLDWVFMDGNHKYEPTMRYFQQISPYLHNESIVIIDDIYWSGEMNKAWTELRTLPQVTASIDLYGFGLLFFRKEQEKEHFILRF